MSKIFGYTLSSQINHGNIDFLKRWESIKNVLVFLTAFLVGSYFLQVFFKPVNFFPGIPLKQVTAEVQEHYTYSRSNTLMYTFNNQEKIVKMDDNELNFGSLGSSLTRHAEKGQKEELYVNNSGELIISVASVYHNAIGILGGIYVLGMLYDLWGHFLLGVFSKDSKID